MKKSSKFLLALFSGQFDLYIWRPLHNLPKIVIARAVYRLYGKFKGFIEAFDNSITPSFSFRDEDNFDPHQQAEPEDDARGSEVTIASPKAEFGVDLDKVGDLYGLPAADQAQSHGLVVFVSLWMEKDPMAVEIDNVERIETAIVLDISWTHEIRLMDTVDSQSVCEIGDTRSLSGDKEFF